MSAWLTRKFKNGKDLTILVDPDRPRLAMPYGCFDPELNVPLCDILERLEAEDDPDERDRFITSATHLVALALTDIRVRGYHVIRGEQGRLVPPDARKEDRSELDGDRQQLDRAIAAASRSESSFPDEFWPRLEGVKRGSKEALDTEAAKTARFEAALRDGHHTPEAIELLSALCGTGLFAAT